MSSAIYLRLVGYSVTLAIHSFTFHDVLARMAVTTKDPVVADFATLQDKFLTIWTFMFQIIYVILGLSCDLLNLSVGGDKSLTKTLFGLRETLFAAIVWPTSLLVPTCFWPLYLYDSLLLFPPFIDKILSWWNNQIMHSYVAVFVFWELMFLNRKQRRHKLNLALLAVYLLTYLVVLFNSFHDRDSFIYPILNHLYGTAYFPLFIIIVVIITLFHYSIQWPLTSLVWGTKTEKRQGKKSK